MVGTAIAALELQKIVEGGAQNLTGVNLVNVWAMIVHMKFNKPPAVRRTVCHKILTQRSEVRNKAYAVVFSFILCGLVFACAF